MARQLALVGNAVALAVEGRPAADVERSGSRCRCSPPRAAGLQAPARTSFVAPMAVARVRRRARVELGRGGLVRMAGRS